MRHNRQLAIVDRVAYYGGHLAYIEHDPGRRDPGDSGLSVLGEEALGLPEIPDERLLAVCLHCLIDHHPYIGRGLDIARRKGRAIRVGDDWIYN